MHNLCVFLGLSLIFLLLLHNFGICFPYCIKLCLLGIDFILEPLLDLLPLPLQSQLLAFLFFFLLSGIFFLATFCLLHLLLQRILQLLFLCLLSLLVPIDVILVRSKGCALALSRCSRGLIVERILGPGWARWWCHTRRSLTVGIALEANNLRPWLLVEV